jgi:D-3-phosphoglycerate dehydrogenase / 2-oxoglutarate reductase
MELGMTGQTPTIVVADTYLGSIDHEEMLAKGRAVVRAAHLATAEDVAVATADADAVLVTTHPLTADHIAAFGPHMRMIGRAGVGLDSIDLAAAAAKGVAVYHTPDYCVAEVADQTLTDILVLVRQMRDQMIVGRTPGWAGRDRITIHALEALTVGVVGVGRIGRAVLERLAPFNVKRLAFDPVTETMPDGVERVDSLDALLAGSDVVTLHLPLLPETRGLISRDAISRMRPGAYLVNVSRGPLVDTVALVEALEQGHLAGAVVDVLDREPIAGADPLLSASNAILTPHIAWQSVEAGVRVRAQTMNAVLAYLSGADPDDGRIAVRP